MSYKEDFVIFEDKLKKKKMMKFGIFGTIDKR